MAGENKVQLEFELGNSALTEVQQLRDELIKLKNDLAETNKKLKEGFEGARSGAQKATKEVLQFNEKIQSQSSIIQKLRAELDIFKATSVKSFSAAGAEIEGKPNSIVSKLKAAVGAVRSFALGAKEGFLDAVRAAQPVKNAVDDVGNTADKSAKKVRNLSNEIGSESSGNKGLIGSIKAVGKNIAAYFVVDRIIAFGRAIFDTVSKFQKFEAVLTTTLGSRSEAQKALRTITAFAAETPFQVDELTESFVKLANRGFIPTKEQLKNIGDLAASQDKSFTQLTEAILDAQTGEFERLKEFGIRASKSGDTVKVSFGGITKEVKNTESAIRDAILEIGKLPKVAGGMAAISKTIGGAASNLKDSFTSVLDTVGNKFAPAITSALVGLSSFLGFLKRALSDDVPAAIKPLADGFKSLYDGITTVTKAILEFVGLDTGVDTLRRTFTKLSDAVGVVTNAAGELLRTFANLLTTGSGLGSLGGLFKPLTAQINEVLDGIIQMPFEFAGAKAAVQKFVQNIIDDFIRMGNSIEKVGLKVKLAFTFDDKAEAAIKKQISGLDALNAKIKAGQNSPTDAYNKAYSQAKAEDAARRKAAQEDEAARKALNAEDGSLEGGNIAGSETIVKKLAENAALTEAEIKKLAAAQKKASADREKQIREYEAYIKRVADLEKQLAEARVEVMEEGRQKEIAVENARSAAAINSLDILKNRFANLKNLSKDQQAELNLINQVIEQQKTLHNKKLLDIDAKYYKEAIAAFETAQDNINAVLLKDEEKEINDINKKYERIFKAIEEAEKKILESNASPIQKQVQIGILNQGRASAEEKEQKEILLIQQRSALKRLEEEEKLALALIDIMKVAGLTEKEVLHLKENDKLNFIISSGKKQLKILDAMGDEASKLAAAKLTLAIQQAEKQLKVLASTGTFSIAGILEKRFKLDEDEKAALLILGKSLGDLYGEITKSIELNAQRRIDAIDREISKLDDKISKQEEILDREKSLQEQGFANNLQLEEQNLANLQALREEEMRQREDQQKKIAAIHKQQAALQAISIAKDGVEQTVNLITAATSIFKDSGKLGLPGVLLGIAAIATMVTTFLTVKNQIKAATADVPKFFKGGGILLDGATHAEGGIKLVDSKTGKVKAEAQRDEYGYFFKDGKKVKADYDPVLSAINKGELKNWSYKQIRPFIKEERITLNHEYINSIRGYDKNNIRMESSNTMNIKTSKAEALLERVATSNEKLLNLEVNREELTEYPDKTVIRKGNRTRIIRKN